MTRRKTTTQIFIHFKAKVVIDLEFRWALANAKKMCETETFTNWFSESELSRYVSYDGNFDS